MIYLTKNIKLKLFRFKEKTKQTVLRVTCKSDWAFLIRCASSIIKTFQVNDWKNEVSFIIYSYVVNKISNFDVLIVSASSLRSSLAPVKIWTFNPGVNLLKFDYPIFS